MDARLRSNIPERSLLNTEVSVGPFFNWFNPKCSDVWTSTTYFASNPVKQMVTDNVYFRRNPIAYWVYGAKNYIVWSQVHDFLLRTIDTIKVFSNSNEKVTTVAFSRDLLWPRVYIGSDRGGSVVYDFHKQAFVKEAVDHIDDARLFHSKKITSADWSDHENVFYSIDTILVHWNIRTGIIEHVYVGESEFKPRCISTICISKVEPYYIAVGYEGGQIVILYLSNKMTSDGGIMYKFHTQHADICSLAFPFEKGNYSEGIIASMGRDGSLTVFDLYVGKKIIDYCSECKKVASQKNRNYFAIAFVPTYPCDRKVPSDSDDDDPDRTNFQLLMSAAGGELKCLYIPKSPPAALLKRPKTVDFDRQKMFFHNNVLFTISTILGFDGTAKDSEDAWFSLGVSVSLDRQAILWDLKEKRAKSAYPTLSHQIHDLAFNDLDPTHLAIASGEGLKLWKVSNYLDEGKSIDPYRILTIRKNLPQNAKLTTVAWNPLKEKQLATGTDDGQIFVLDVSQSKPSMKYTNLQTKDRDKTQIYTLTWGPVPSQRLSQAEPLQGLYCVQAGGKFKVHLPVSSKVLDFTEISDSPKDYGWTEVSWRSDYSYLAVGNEDGSIEIYECNLEKYSQLRLVIIVQSIHSKLVQCLRWHPISIKVTTDHNDFSDIETFAPVSELRFWLASGSNDSKIQLIDFKQTLEDLLSNADATYPLIVTEPTRTLTGHSTRVISLSWSVLVEGLLASCSYDSTVQIWDAKKGTPLHNFRGHTSKLYTVCWSNLDPDLIYSGGDDNTVHVWRPSKQKYKVPPTVGSSSESQAKPKTNGRQPDNGGTSLSWPVYQTSIDAKFKEIEDNIAKCSSVIADENTDQTPQTLAFGEGGDIRPTGQLIDDKQDSSDGQESNSNGGQESSSNSRAVIDMLRNKGRRALSPVPSAKNPPTSQPKEKKKEKSVLPLVNVFENCSRKEDHYQDIEYLLSQRSKSGTERDHKTSFSVDVAKRTLIFSDKSSVEELVLNESLHHRRINSKSNEYMVLLLQGDVQKTVKEAMKKRELNETLVAMAASVSRTFWFEAAQAYALQLENQGEFTMAALYLMSIYKVKEAITLLLTKKLFKEALILAKSRLHIDGSTSNAILREWAKEKEALGNYETAVKCLIVCGAYLDAANVLSKRSTEYSSLYYAARLCKEGNHAQQFTAHFGHAFKEGCARSMSLTEMQNLLDLWDDHEERAAFVNFVEFLKVFNDHVSSSSLESISTSYSKWEGPVSAKGAEFITMFLNVDSQSFVAGKRELILRVAYHVFMVLVNKLLSKLSDGWPYMPRVSCITHLLQAFEAVHSSYALSDDPSSTDLSNSKLLANLCSLTFPQFFASDFNAILEGISEHLHETFGFPLETDEQVMKKLTIICHHWYLRDILHSVRHNDFVGHKFQFACFTDNSQSLNTGDGCNLVTCEQVKGLLDNLESRKLDIGGLPLLSNEVESEVLQKFCTC